MKHFNIYFRVLALTFLVSLTCVAVRASESVATSDVDSVEISLLTCGPGNEVYSLYGHTAIRYNDLQTGNDIVINYGMFSFRQDYFIIRFIFGLTDYQMGIVTFDEFMAEYRAEQRWVCQQTLNLTSAEKVNIKMALLRNYAPENCVYRYNFFYNNCTTKARDVIIDNISGKVTYEPVGLDGVTFRSMLHQWNEQQRWNRLGVDLLLGVGADRQVSMAERQFLPDSLRRDFDGAYVLSGSGERRKLVSDSKMIFLPSVPVDAEATVVTPAMVASFLLIIVILVTAAEMFARRIFYIFDGIWLVATGLGGLVLLAMVFSKHPTVNVNFQLLILSPTALVGCFPIINKLRCYSISRWLKFHGQLIILAMFLGIWQHYDLSVWILASSLLLRIVVLNYWCKRKDDK